MGDQINKHGLPRHIPSPIKAQIRKDDGYGCINCGCIFVQYEHIDPLFCDAKVHDPSKMTLLCSGCHDESTGKRLPKRIIEAKKKNPYCKKVGFAKSKKFYPSPNKMRIEIGNSSFSNTDIALTINGKPFIWVTKDSSDPYSPLLYNAIFMDSTGEKVGYLNNNQFIGIVGSCDFQAIASRIEVRSKEREINLILEIEGDSVIRIKKLFFGYQGEVFKLNNDGSISLSNNCRIGGIHTDNCLGGLAIGNIPNQISPFTKLDTAILFTKAKKISDIFGIHSGFLLDNRIYDLKYRLVGLVENQKIHNLLGEYIGEVLEIKDSYIHIVVHGIEYPDQEPIWISPKNKDLFLFQPSILADTSYRLFGFKAI